jgi:hypothetical protein
MHDGSLTIPIMRHNFSQSSFQGLGTSQPKPQNASLNSITQNALIFQALNSITQNDSMYQFFILCLY